MVGLSGEICNRNFLKYGLGNFHIECRKLNFKLSNKKNLKYQKVKNFSKEIKFPENITLDPTYNELGYNQRLVPVSRCLCIKLIDCSV